MILFKILPLKILVGTLDVGKETRKPVHRAIISPLSFTIISNPSCSKSLIEKIKSKYFHLNIKNLGRQMMSLSLSSW